jgi:DNA-binding winged helix-turn-helix (wHTH) protein/Tol biopolymer transport system component
MPSLGSHQELAKLSPGVVRFGAFELDLAGAELRRKGRPLSLQQQPMLILIYLVSNAGRVVSRDELRSALWPSGTFVEFEFGIYTAINRLRRTLGDSAADPHYIETVPTQGYRFIAPVIGAENVVPAAAEIAAETIPDPPVLEPPALEPAAPQVPAVRWFRHLPTVALAVSGILFVASLTFLVRAQRMLQTAVHHQVYRSTINLPHGQFVASLALSPAGDQIVYEGLSQGSRMLYRRYLDEPESRTIAGTEDAHAPFFSPDGQKIGFYTAGKLKVSGPGGIVTVASFSGSFDQWAADWGEDGFIYYAARVGDYQGIWRVTDRGGQPEQLIRTALGSRGIEFVFPNSEAGVGRPVLFYSTDEGATRRSLKLMDLRSRAVQTVIEHGVGGKLLPTGHLLYYAAGSLFAVPFDERRLRIAGTPAEVVRGVKAHSWMRGEASVSRDGTLAYIRQPDLKRKRLEWVDPNGNRTVLPIAPAAYEQAVVSPDGQKLALVRQDNQSHWSLWTYGLQNGAWTHHLEATVPGLRVAWSPDSASLFASTELNGSDLLHLVRLPLDNSENPVRLTEQSDFSQIPQSASAAAKAVLFMEGVHALTNGDIFSLPLKSGAHPHALVATPGWDRAPAFSPDGHWFIYESNSTGTPAIYLQGYDPETGEAAGTATQISAAGGNNPVWSTDGKRVLYVDVEGNLISVEVSNGKTAGKAKEVIHGFSPAQVDLWTRSFSMAPDARFLVMEEVNPAVDTASRIEIVVNWFEDLKRLSPLP